MRNPVTDIAAMVSATDIPDWCFVETLGREAYSDLPSTEALVAMRKASPVRYVSEVAKHARPVLMLLGGVDLRVPPTNGLRYAAALREAGGSCEVRVFPTDSHGLTNPRTEFESFVTVAGFLRRNVMN
jgi:acylaminoacyl-peptidase